MSLTTTRSQYRVQTPRISRPMGGERHWHLVRLWPEISGSVHPFAQGQSLTCCDWHCSKIIGYSESIFWLHHVGSLALGQSSPLTIVNTTLPIHCAISGLRLVFKRASRKLSARESRSTDRVHYGHGYPAMKFGQPASGKTFQTRR
jgi:hypothetical protein